MMVPRTVSLAICLFRIAWVSFCSCCLHVLATPLKYALAALQTCFGRNMTHDRCCFSSARPICTSGSTKKRNSRLGVLALCEAAKKCSSLRVSAHPWHDVCVCARVRACSTTCCCACTWACRLDMQKLCWPWRSITGRPWDFWMKLIASSAKVRVNCKDAGCCAGPYYPAQPGRSGCHHCYPAPSSHHLPMCIPLYCSSSRCHARGRYHWGTGRSCSSGWNVTRQSQAIGQFQRLPGEDLSTNP